MKRFLIFCCLLALGPVLAVQADARFPVPPPPAPPEPTVKVETAALVIEMDDKVKEPRLQVPRPLLDAKDAPADRKDKSNGPRGEAPSLLPTIMTGLALALAFTCGGLWFARHRGGRGFALLLATGLLLSAGAAASWADRAPARPAVAPVAGPTELSRLANISFQTTEKGDVIKLTVTRGQMEQLIYGPRRRR